MNPLPVRGIRSILVPLRSDTNTENFRSRVQKKGRVFCREFSWESSWILSMVPEVLNRPGLEIKIVRLVIGLEISSRDTLSPSGDNSKGRRKTSRRIGTH